MRHIKLERLSPISIAVIKYLAWYYKNSLGTSYDDYSGRVPYPISGHDIYGKPVVLTAPLHLGWL